MFATSLYRSLHGLHKVATWIKTKIRHAILAQGTVADDILQFEALNTGNVPVTLAEVQVRFPGSPKTVAFPGGVHNVKFPHDLPPGQSCIAIVSPYKLATALRESGFSGATTIVAQFRDAVDRYYRSEPYHFDIERWTQK